MSDEELAKEVAKALNSFNFDPEKFCKAMRKEHRTLQQCFTRVCLEWFKQNAKLNDYEYDGRNEATVKVSRIIADTLEKENITNVPFI